MAEIVNLRRHRKRKARAEQDAAAAENRAAFGQPKAAREAAEREQARAAAHLDGHRRETDGRDDLP